MLIEALVTIAIVSFGLLGIIGMLVFGISSANMSKMRTTAVNLAYEIAENMRANQTGVSDSIASSAGYVVTDSAASLPAKLCKPEGSTVLPTSCDPLEMAAADVYFWKKKIEQLLPGGKGSISQISGSVPMFEISIVWMEDTKSSTNLNFKLRFEP